MSKAIRKKRTDEKPDQKQCRAANPSASVWVNASAGTGKTRVLTNRVLRLLLSGTAPERILCITFTNAGAAEMESRIGDVLSKWAVASDTALAEDLEVLTGVVPDADMLTAARRLFARVVDVPDGLKVMTIHSFCKSVLKRFPLESGVPPHFELIDERTGKEYLRAAQHRVIARAGAEDGPLQEALSHLAMLVNAGDMADLLGAVAQERERLRRSLAAYGNSPDAMVAAIYQSCGIDVGTEEEDILRAASAEGAYDEEGLRRAAAALAGGGKTDTENSLRMESWLNENHEGRAGGFSAWMDVFLRKKRDKIRDRLATKNVVKACPEALTALQKEAERLFALLDVFRAQKTASASAALLRASLAILETYDDIKTAAGELDYDDLVYKTLNLLQRTGYTPWVLYRLDGGLDHILVDEAQDTNPEQWQIVKALADDFFSGAGRHDGPPRTLFVVGDEKQSIFSFQRADPEKFREMRAYFEEKIRASGQLWEEVELDTSFRSSPAVLEVVDRVFSEASAQNGVGKNIRHIAHHTGRAGKAMLWPLVEPPAPPPPEPWAAPVAVYESASPLAQLAENIADTISGWLERGEILESKGRPIQPGDIMILLRSRGTNGEKADHLIRALKKRNINVAGTDRMKLTEQLGILDLLAFAHFLLLPEDDLTLATLLKTPLIGLEEDVLFDLCYGRTGSLWQEVQKKNSAVAGYLRHFLTESGFITPYQLFAEILARPCPADNISGRRAFQARLGHEVMDPLDELLNAALTFEKAHMPSLQGFVDWFERGESEIKREMGGARQDEVRIMTVHGAKGLESPIVFLPDTASLPSSAQNSSSKLLWPEEENAPPLWIPHKESGAPVWQDLYTAKTIKTLEEYRRLFYVALTRAEDRLYICGYRGRNGAADGTWHDFANHAFGESPVIECKQITPPEDKKNTVQRRGEIPPLPVWARQPAPAEEMPPRPLMPSRPSEEEEDPAMVSPLGEDRGQRFHRGILAHRLLESLPDLPPGQREAACRQFLARPAAQMDPAAQEELTREVLAVLNHPDFAAIFGSGSRAEVPVTGLVSDTRILSGQIDRMLVTDTDVLLVDYKTNRPPPKTVAEVDSRYLRQMAAYRSAVQKIYPGRDVRCVLLWTYTLSLMPLENAALDACSV